jgi:hypothetical protein
MVMHQAQFAQLDLFPAATLAGVFHRALRSAMKVKLPKKPPQKHSKQSTGVPAIGSDSV